MVIVVSLLRIPSGDSGWHPILAEYSLADALPTVGSVAYDGD
ncbi:MAG: hypothetical protein ABGZ17_28390 [Planctomycetaceae bacterium]